MSVVKPVLVNLHAQHADQQSLAHESLGSAPTESAVHGIDDEMPVHHLVAVDEVAVKDEAESDVLIVLWVRGVER